MAALEEEGLIAQPHTSAGRIPTDKGYRFFVDRLTQVKPMSAAERRAISSFLEGAHDLDDVVQRSVRLLAQLTQQVATIVQYPSLARSTVRHVELVHLTAGRVLLVLILSTGRVEQRVVELPTEVDTDVLADLRTRLLRAAVGETIHRGRHGAGRPLTEQVAPDRRTHAAVIVAALVEAMADERHTERVVVGGTANLARSATGSTRSIKPMLEALEEHVVLLKLLGEATSPETVTVRIGHEGPYQELATTSVVATGYGPRGGRRRPRRWSAPPAWTTPGRWRRCARSRATSPRSSTRPEPSAQAHT